MESSRTFAQEGHDSPAPSDDSALLSSLQSAVANIEAITDALRSISVLQKHLLRSRTEQDVVENLTSALVDHFQAFFARVWLTRPGDICQKCHLAAHCAEKLQCLHLVASSGHYTHLDGGHARVPLGAFKIGLIAQGRGKIISNDVVSDEHVHNRAWAEQLGLQSFAGFPIVLDDRVVGVLAMFSRSVLPDHLQTTLELLTDLAASALENARRFQLEAQLGQARKLESIGQLAAGVAHEINSPLQFLSDNIEFIGDGTARLCEVLGAYDRVSAKAGGTVDWQRCHEEIGAVCQKVGLRELLDQLPAAANDSREGVHRVMEIVRAMRQVSRPDTQEMVPTDLNEIVRNTLVVARNRWKNVADVEMLLDSALPFVPVHATEINQVLLNLLINAADAIAVKVSADPTARGRISIRTRDDGDHVIIEIEDTGCGIPESIQSRIFDPFFTTKDVGKGTGQGLTVCRNIVTSHDGTLEVESTPGSGSCFRVKLPKEPAFAIRDAADDGAESAPLG